MALLLSSSNVGDFGCKSMEDNETNSRLNDQRSTRSNHLKLDPEYHNAYFYVVTQTSSQPPR